MSKKKFELNQNINSGLSKIVKLSENYHSLYDTQTIGIEDIKTDPTNPRKLSITKTDIEAVRGKLKLSPTDEKFFEEMNNGLNKLVAKNAGDKAKRLEENEKLIELAFSIHKNGLLHPILVYKDSGNYLIVAGERRFLAHVILGELHVEVKAFKEKPSGLDRKMAQWVENIQRDDLSLYSKLLNIKDIADEYKSETGNSLTPSVLSQISGMTKSPASKYLSTLKAPEDVLTAINTGEIRDLESAVTISRVNDLQKRKELIESIKRGASRKKIREEVAKPVVTKKKGAGRGRKASRVSLGYTNNAKTARAIVDAVLKQHNLSELSEMTSKLDWDNYSEISALFKKLVSVLEGKI